MHKRLIWLAPIALATLLNGCQVTVTTAEPIAPSSLVGYSLVFTHSRTEGVLPGHSSTYRFKSESVAFDASLNEARSWTYRRRSHRAATVELIFTDPNAAALRVTCELEFDTSQEGEHDCVYVHSATFAFIEFSSEGSSKGTFRRQANETVP